MSNVGTTSPMGAVDPVSLMVALWRSVEGKAKNICRPDLMPEGEAYSILRTHIVTDQAELYQYVRDMQNKSKRNSSNPRAGASVTQSGTGPSVSFADTSSTDTPDTTLLPTTSSQSSAAAAGGTKK